MKKHIALAFAAALIVSPAAAQQDDDDSSLMEQGLQLFLDGLREDESVPEAVGVLLEDIYQVRGQLQQLGSRAEGIRDILAAKVHRGTT